VEERHDRRQSANRARAGQFIVRNISSAVSQTRLSFDLASGSETFLGSGAIEVDLGSLFQLWQRGGKRGSGGRAIGRTTIAVSALHAYIDSLKLSPREDHIVTVRFPLRRARPRQREFTLHVTQLNFAKGPKLTPEITGGETFLIRNAPPHRQ
jgi:hypothetical protein